MKLEEIIKITDLTLHFTDEGTLSQRGKVTHSMRHIYTRICEGIHKMHTAQYFLQIRKWLFMKRRNKNL